MQPTERPRLPVAAQILIALVTSLVTGAVLLATLLVVGFSAMACDSDGVACDRYESGFAFRTGLLPGAAIALVLVLVAWRLPAGRRGRCMAWAVPVAVLVSLAGFDVVVVAALS